MKTTQLKFEDQGKEYIADFQHVRALYKCEESNFFTMSGLDEVSVYPKPIERQRVEPCLKVFSEKVIVALELWDKDKSVDVKGTVLFIKKVLNW